MAGISHNFFPNSNLYQCKPLLIIVRCTICASLIHLYNLYLYLSYFLTAFLYFVKTVFLQIAILPKGCFWALFEGPWAKIVGTQLLKIGSKSSTWTSHSPFHLRSTLFHPFGTTRAFRSPFWPIWAVFGPFLGPGGPKFDKFCVREVGRGPGHL